MLVGDGPESVRLKGLADSLGLLPDGVEFAGRRDDVPALMARAAMLVLSSDHEGFPNVVMEAMAARLPVVATPAGDAADLVADGVTGHVVPFDDVPLMAERMASLARSPARAREFGAAGRLRVEQNFGHRGLLGHLLNAYGEAARKRGDAAILDHVRRLAP